MAHTVRTQDTDRRTNIVETQLGGVERRQEVVQDLSFERDQTLNRLSQFIWLLFGILEGLILIRVFLKLIAANPANPFARLIYGLTDLFLWPFFGLTITPSAEGIVFEIPSLIALIVYALIGWVIVRLVWLLFDRPSRTSVTTYERE
jgi:YggT family protein